MSSLDVIGSARELSWRARPLVVRDVVRAKLVLPIVVPAPAAGNEWAYTVPADSTYELLSVFFTLTTSATVANRSPSLHVNDPQGNTFVRIGAPATIAENNSTRVSGYAGLGIIQSTTTHNFSLPSPPIVVPGAWVITTNTIAIQAGDTYTNVRLLVRDLREYDAMAYLDAVADRMWHAPATP
jgi:hypothetical protein